MLGLHRVVEDALKHLNDQEEQHLHPAHHVTVLFVGFAAGHEDPEPLHHLALNYVGGGI